MKNENWKNDFCWDQRGIKLEKDKRCLEMYFFVFAKQIFKSQIYFYLELILVLQFQK